MGAVNKLAMDLAPTFAELLEAAMERYIHEQNLLNYRKLIAASAIDPARNEIQHSVAVFSAFMCKT